MTSPYYTPSGKAPLRGILFSLASGLAAALIGGVIYAAAVWYIPFVYLNMVFCGLLALAIGLGVGLCGKAGHLRSPSLATLIGLFCGLAALYMQWAAYLAFIYSKQASSYFGLLGTILADPAGMVKVIGSISERGLWSIKSIRPSGLMLQAMWAMEALILMLGAAFFARSPVQEPYSEGCGAWMEEETLSPAIAPVTDPASFRATLERGDLSPLLQSILPVENTAFAFIKTHSCDGDATAYISVVNTEITRKGSKEESSDTEIVEYLRVPLSAVHELRAHLAQLQPVQVTPGV